MDKITFMEVDTFLKCECGEYYGIKISGTNDEDVEVIGFQCLNDDCLSSLVIDKEEKGENIFVKMINWIKRRIL